MTLAQAVPQGAAAQTGELEEIMVTAQRRSEPLQRVPISITAVTAATLAKAGITDTQALAQVTPGLTLNAVRGAVTPFVRGVGTINVTAGDEGATAIYVDGILNPVAASNVFALNNVERVEVLRGPQGTLFGRNAVGGLINIITRDPSQDFGGNAEIGYANYNTVSGSAYVTGGLAHNVAADLAVYESHQGDGWGHNLNLGVDQNRNRETAARSKLLVELSDDTRVTLAGDFSRADSDIGSSRQGLPGTVVTGGQQFTGSIYDSRGEVPPLGHKKQYGTSVKIQHELTDAARLQSISAYRHYEVSSNLDADGSPVKVVEVHDRQIAKTFQQEILLTGEAARLDYTTGLFYFYSSATYDPVIVRSNTRAPNNISTVDTQTTNSYSGFAQGTYHLTDTTRVTGGLRYTRDERNIDGTITALAGFPAPAGTLLGSTTALPDSQTHRKFEKLTWRGVIDQQLGTNVLAYASISRGFKSGVFSTTAPTTPAVAPETLDAYEVGVKADLFDRSLRVNLAAFHYDYKNIQITTIAVTGAPVLLNAAAGKFDGIDGEIVYVAPISTGSLEFRSSFSALNTKYSSFPNAPFYTPIQTPAGVLVGGNIPSIGDATGNRTIQAPKFTSSLSTDYTIPISQAGTLGLTATWSYNSGFYWDPQNRVREPSFSLVNGQISFTSADEAWRVRFFGTNLFDKERYLYVSVGSQGDTGAPAAPRTYGIALSRNF
jgi:iron complex outermembrane receptor protein